MEYEYCPVTHKRCYGQKDANNVIAHAKYSKGSKTTPMRSYFCKHCGAYHLTHFKTRIRMGEKTTKHWYKAAKEKYKNYYDEED